MRVSLANPVASNNNSNQTISSTTKTTTTMAHQQPWAQKPIRNILLDINGVLFESGEDHAIAGSVEAMNLLKQHGFRFCLVTNECTTAKRLLARKLNNFGYDFIEHQHIVSPAPVACRYLQRENLVPRLHIWDGVAEDFGPVLSRLQGYPQQPKQPNCLVVGDIMDKLSRDFMDESLEMMLNSPEPPRIVSLGAGRYYKDAGHLRMDTGAYVAAFEFCLGVEAINFGKPTEAFFREALDVVGGQPDDTIMIGDDIVSDVGGAQKLGMRGFLVRTGKYKKSDETERGVTADFVFDNLKQAMEMIIDQEEGQTVILQQAI